MLGLCPTWWPFLGTALLLEWRKWPKRPSTPPNFRLRAFGSWVFLLLSSRRRIWKKAGGGSCLGVNPWEVAWGPRMRCSPQRLSSLLPPQKITECLLLPELATGCSHCWRLCPPCSAPSPDWTSRGGKEGTGHELGAESGSRGAHLRERRGKESVPCTGLSRGAKNYRDHGLLDQGLTAGVISPILAGTPSITHLLE